MEVMTMKDYTTLPQTPGLEPRYQIAFRGARGLMVMVVGNGHYDTSSNPGRD